jgi:hypothetical protein
MKKACFLTVVTIILVSMISFGQTNLKEFTFEEHDFKISFNQPPIASSDSSEFNDSPLITYYWEEALSLKRFFRRHKNVILLRKKLIHSE